MNPVVKIRNLSVQFKHQSLFDGFSLDVMPGEKLTISGPSGSGKSTLLRCIIGFLTPDDGIIQVMGKTVSAATIWRLRGLMAYVAQEPELGEGIVRDALKRPFGYKQNASLTYNEEEALSIFEGFQLKSIHIETPITQLSGGEKQRVALAGALMLKRPLLLLDEAASALDPAAKQSVRDYLRTLSDCTILSVSHDTRAFVLSSTLVDLGDPVSGATP